MLNDYFTTPKRSGFDTLPSPVEKEAPLVVLADELDYLFTKNQQVIYKLFDWPHDPNSRLIVIVGAAGGVSIRASPTPSICLSA